MHPILSEKEKEVAKLCEKYDVDLLYVFGSAVDGTFNLKESDLDFLVTFNEKLSPKEQGANMLAMMDELEHLFKRKVDLLRDRPFKNPYFAKAVHSNKTLLYAAA